jgi:nucleoside phosphorylase
VRATILIVTVNKIESTAVLEAFNRITGAEPVTISHDRKVYRDLGIVNGVKSYLVRSEMGSSGVGAAQQTVQKGIEAFKPSAVIIVGVAFGVDPDRQSIGDVLISRQLQLYDSKRVGTGDSGDLKMTLRGDTPHASEWLIDYFSSAELSWKGQPLNFGLLLSGEELLDNIDRRDQLRELAPEALGGEMEGTGLYVACQVKKVDWIVIKGICDWADGRKGINKDERQRTAANNAVGFLLHALQHAPLRAEQEWTSDWQWHSLHHFLDVKDIRGSKYVWTKKTVATPLKKQYLWKDQSITADGRITDYSTNIGEMRPPIREGGKYVVTTIFDPPLEPGQTIEKCLTMKVECDSDDSRGFMMWRVSSRFQELGFHVSLPPGRPLTRAPRAEGRRGVDSFKVDGLRIDDAGLHIDLIIQFPDPDTEYVLDWEW